MFPFGTTEASRKYVDLIYKISTKWANWDPPKQIKVGDYGKINEKTGEFEKEDNIYSAKATAVLVAQYPPIEECEQEKIEIVSETAKRCEISAGVDIGFPNLAQASLQGKWEFGKNRGALLIMVRPRITHIPNNTFLEELSKMPIMVDKVLVTEVVTCHAYTSYLSTKNSDVITLALIGSFPVPSAPGVTASGDMKWYTNNVTGLLQSASAKEDKFSPLFVIKKIPKKNRTFYRDSPAIDPTGDHIWVDAPPPWSDLDEDGNEEPYEDTVFYDEGEEQPESDADSPGT